MKNLIAVGFVTALAACGGGGNNTTVMIHDSGSNGSADATVTPGCSVLTQAGCDPGQKCTWVLSTDPTATMSGLGANACAPDGAKAAGAACTTQTVAMGGADDCIHGTVCVSGTCKQICDNAGGTPACGTNQACVAYDGLFANSGSTTIPAGVCDPSCNPLDDNDFDGSGTAHTKTGTACGTSATVGCYGNISSSHTSYFTCAPPAGGTGALTHRSVIPAAQQYLNSCMSGYGIAFAHDATGSNNIDCYAFCKPGDAYMGNTAAQNPNGVTPHLCRQQDALGAFGAPATAAGANGEHCMYSWNFELDAMGMLHRSPTSDTVGICFDHTKYMYDSNGDGTPDAIIPSCVNLPPTSTTAISGDGVGCISTTIAGVTFGGKIDGKGIVEKRLRLGIEMPELPTMNLSQR